jgi:hypothetical protein
MALVNPNIAMGYRGIELANPLAQYGQVAAIQNAQNQNQLANMQMQEYSRAREEEQGIRNRLTGGASLEDPETRNFLLGSKAGREILQRQSELQKSQTEEAARRAKLMADTEGMYRNMSGQISNKADAATFLQRMVNDPALKGSPIASIPIMQQIQRIPEDPQGLDNWVKQFALGTTKYITENKPTTQVIDQSGQRQVIQLPGLGGAPTTVGTYADVPLPAAVAAQKAQIARAGAPTITNVAEKAEAGEFGKLLVKGFEDVSNAAKVATRTLPSLDANLAILDKGFTTGFGTEAQTAAASVLAALGVEKAKDFATNSQTFLANASNAVLQRQLEQKGPQTEADAQRITQTGVQLGNTPKANRFLIDIAREQFKRDIEQRNFYANWQERNGSFKGAENAWFAGEGGKSLFERPSLKKYTGPADASSDSGRPSLDSIFKGKKP